MFMQEFVIPLNKKELLGFSKSGHYYVQEVYEVDEIREKIEAARLALNEEGPNFIVDHFPAFFSLLCKFQQCSQLSREKGWKTLRKGFTLLSKNLQVLLEDSANLDCDVQSHMCNVTKMLVFLLLENMKLYQDEYMEQHSNSLDAKTKKKQNKLADNNSNWTSEKHSVLDEIHMFLQLPIKLLWEPPVVEEEFINLIANFCYKCLEDPIINSVSLKPLREMIFQVFGVLIRKYLHGLSFCVKIVQLLKISDHLVNTLAQGIVHLYKVCDCKNIVKEIIREIADTDGDQLAADTTGTRNLNFFIVQLSESIPEAIIPALDLLVAHLNGDSYSMRICIIGVLGEIVLTTFTKENLDENMKKMRDEYLDCLEEHIHDVNAFVRTKVLSVWQKLCTGNAIPILRLNSLLEVTIGRLKDKSTNVKKQAVHLIRDLLERNPFCGQLNISEIRTQLKEEEKKLESIEKTYNLRDCDSDWNKIEESLQNLMKDWVEDDAFDLNVDEGDSEKLVAAVGNYLCGGEYSKAISVLFKLKNEFYKIYNMNKENLSPEIMREILRKIYVEKKKRCRLDLPAEIREEIEKLNGAIEYLQRALEFSQLIDRALPIVKTFFDSNSVSDVLEAIRFFSAAYLFDFKKAASDGIRKMLHLVFSKEASIKSAVSSAYQELYFPANLTGRQRSVASVKSLSELVLSLSFGQLDAFEEVVKQWVKSEVIDQNCVQVMFERFSMKSPGVGIHESWAALVLIRMVGAEEPKIIKNNLNVLLNEGFRKHGAKNFLVARETCNALQNLLPPKEQGKAFDQTLRFSRDHEMFAILFDLLKTGIWKTEDPHYIPMAEESINLVFSLCDRPDAFCEDVLSHIHRSILSGKPPSESKDLPPGNVLYKKNSASGFLLENINKGDSPEEDNDEGVKEKKVQNEVYVCLITRFIAILGQVAANYLLFLEGPVLDEFKLRNQLDYERKLKKLEDARKGNVSLRRKKKDIGDGEADKTLNESGVEQLEFNRGTADDADVEDMKFQTENEIVLGCGFLSKFTPMILSVCRNPKKYDNNGLQNSALLTLAKFMTVSSAFCEENLQLLVTICEKSNNPERQQNALIALGALQYRFPNSLEPWTPRMCAMLSNGDPKVRYTAILVLTDLIVNEMIKVRNHISTLALCIVDKEVEIARVARHFFREYSQKGNSLYNMLPVIVSNLTQCHSPLPPEDFKIVMKFIFGFFTKEKQLEHLVEKLCQYFESATTERQWCDLAYCLSLLNYTDKSLRKILDNVKCFYDKLHLAEVYEAFCVIISEAGKNQQKDKALLGELEVIIKERGLKTCEGPPKKSVPQSTSKKKKVLKKYLPSESEEDEEHEEGEEEEESESEEAERTENKSRGRKGDNKAKTFSYKRKVTESETNEDAEAWNSSSVLRLGINGKVERDDASEDSDETFRKDNPKRSKNSSGKRGKRKIRKYVSSSEEETEVHKRVKNEITAKSLTSCRKRKCN